jgi:hypothetical protein
MLLSGGTLLAGMPSAQETAPAAPATILSEPAPAPMDSGAPAPAAAPVDAHSESSEAPTALAPAPESQATIEETLSDVNISHSSDKVGFSGVIYSRGSNHRYLKMPQYLWPDASRTSMDANFTLKVGVNATSFLKAWSMVSFGYDFAGHFMNSKANTHARYADFTGAGIPNSEQTPDTVVGDYTRAPYLQDKNRESARIFEDLSAGVDIRTEPVDANIRAGSAMWVEGSPFTIWKRDPRPKLAWYYEGYEPEQSSYQYYNQKFFYRRNSLGRLSWPKKPFGGIEADAFRMPFDMGLQIDFAQPSNMLPTKTDGNTYNSPGDAEALGSINSLGQMYYGRLTRKSVFKDVMAGVNALWVELPEDMINQTVYTTTSTTTQGFRYQFRDRNEPFFTKPRVFSVDFRGNLNATNFLQADFALAYEDSVRFHLPDSLANDSTKTGSNFNGNFPRTYSASKPQPAAYIKLNNSGSLPMETELFYAAKDFWSPYAMTEYAVPVHRDEMKLGTGSFSYQPNLIGLSWKVSPKVANGFLSFTVGQHVQAEEGKDILRFQHNLNGRDVWNGSASWSRTEPGRLLDEGVPYYNAKYESRLGEGQRDNNALYLQSQPGGLRGDDQELWEEFAAYEDLAQANTGVVPRSRKIASTLAVDWGYDLAPMIGYSRNFMLATYVAVNSIAKDLTGPINSKETLLWSGLGRLECVVSVSPTFQVIGMVGAENWRSDKAYRNTLYNKQDMQAGYTSTYKLVNDSNGNKIDYNNVLSYEPIMSVTKQAQNADPLVIAAPSPIDYLQTAYGAGFDWDFAPRAGLHVRYKYATHQDKNLPDNDWNGSFFFAESKLWF